MVLATATAAAKDAPSVERGSKLFNSAALGTNGKSCATCHPGGKGLEDVADYDGKKMATYPGGVSPRHETIVKKTDKEIKPKYQVYTLTKQVCRVPRYPTPKSY